MMDTTARGAYFTVQKALPLLSDGGAVVLASVVRTEGLTYRRVGVPASVNSR